MATPCDVKITLTGAADVVAAPCPALQEIDDIPVFPHPVTLALPPTLALPVLASLAENVEFATYKVPSEYMAPPSPNAALLIKFESQILVLDEFPAQMAPPSKRAVHLLKVEL